MERGDYVLLPADKIVTMHVGTVWRELDLNWPDSQATEETGNIVVFADFKTDYDTK
jgi:hypothetical protein